VSRRPNRGSTCEAAVAAREVSDHREHPVRGDRSVTAACGEAALEVIDTISVAISYLAIGLRAFPIGKIHRDPVNSRRSGIKFGRVERKETWLSIEIANTDVAVVFITTAIDIEGIRAGIARRFAQVRDI
jgi:hypothetical protein